MPREYQKVLVYSCTRCHHEWIPRDKQNEPRMCPKCKSAYWDRERKIKRTKKKPKLKG